MLQQPSLKPASWNRTYLAHASLLGGAIGDSLGAEIEFWTLREIESRFPNGFEELPLHRGIRGAITDDTQMTLFTAEGVIRAILRQRVRGIGTVEGPVHHALLRWYETQGERPQMKIDDRGLICDPRLRHRRAPGNTCMTALGHSRRFGQFADNDSKGCGTIMRVAPIGLSIAPSMVAEAAIKTSGLTHGHVTGKLAAAAWAEILSEAADAALEARVSRELVEQIASNKVDKYAARLGGGETAEAIRRALAAPRDARPRTVEMLGGGWTAEEALSIALYSVLATENFEDGLICAVTHGGDSDSTGAIAGNLLGLIYPSEVFEHRWANQVECRHLIERLSHDLVMASLWEDAEIERQIEFYPPV
jgi:ADP-ribosyl-[dinitrogen reductase] hydrolase